jgi:Flp pilus assembly protein TadD
MISGLHSPGKRSPTDGDEARHALHGEARATAAGGDWERALARFDAARDAARVPGQRAAALAGRAACSDRLNRTSDAETALREARELDPTVADPRGTPPTESRGK